MSVGMMLVILIAIVLVGSLPTWPYSRAWGYSPSGGIAIVLLATMILFALGHI